MCVTTTKDIIPLYYGTWICVVIRKSPPDNHHSNNIMQI